MKTKKTYNWLGWVLLIVSLFAGCIVLYWGNFGDEADNLVVGSLLTRGYVLYRDIFSHHFPFAYYWAAAVVSLFGKSILAARLSVLLFQVTSFAIAMKLSRFRLSLGLASLVWNIIGHLYKGNMLLYNMFCGASLVVVFSVTLAIVSRKIDGNWKSILAIGLFSTIAILSDPLSIYAIAVTLIFLLSTPPTGLKQGFVMGLIIAVGLAGYAGYLLISGAFTDFIRDAITFNSQIYSKYVYTNPVRFHDFFEMSIKGLKIFDATWMNTDPMKPICNSYTEFDRWIFTGFLYRLSVILTSLAFVIRKRFRAAGFIYLFAAALLVINEWDFRAASFIMVALVAAAGLIVKQWMRQQLHITFISISQMAFRALVGCMLIWLVIRVAAHTAENRQMLSYKANFGVYESEAARIQTELACGRSDVLLAYYPGNPYIYWFTDMKPVSKYIFMWPWVAEIALPDVINCLSDTLSDKGLAVVYIADAEIWGRYKTRDYLRSLQSYLEESYVKVEEGWYLSPDLAAQCHKQQETGALSNSSVHSSKIFLPLILKNLGW